MDNVFLFSNPPNPRPTLHKKFKIIQKSPPPPTLKSPSGLHTLLLGTPWDVYCMEARRHSVVGASSWWACFTLSFSPTFTVFAIQSMTMMNMDRPYLDTTLCLARWHETDSHLAIYHHRSYPIDILFVFSSLRSKLGSSLMLRNVKSTSVHNHTFKRKAAWGSIGLHWNYNLRLWHF